MYVIVNMETRNILAYRQGDMRVYGNESAARDQAEYAQTFKNHPHQVLHVSNHVLDSLGREEVPWTVR